MARKRRYRRLTPKTRAIGIRPGKSRLRHRAVRMLLVGVAAEKAPPFDVGVPNAQAPYPGTPFAAAYSVGPGEGGAGQITWIWRSPLAAIWSRAVRGRIMHPWEAVPGFWTESPWIRNPSRPNVLVPDSGVRA